MSTWQNRGRVRLRRWEEESDSLKALTGLLHDAYAQHAAEGRRFFASHQTEADTAYRLRGAECWLAHIDGALVGTVTVAAPSRTAESPHRGGNPYYDRPAVGTFYQLAVASHLIKHGIGDLLLRKAEQQLVELGAETAVIDTSEHAHELLGWYGRRGYVRIGELDWSITNYRSIVLEKALTRTRQINAD